MNRPILLSIFATAVAFGYCLWSRDLTNDPIVRAPLDKVGSMAMSGSSPSMANPASATVRVSVKSEHALTDDRKRIFDSSDILKTINDVRRTGSQDQKDWATALLTSCVHLYAKVTPQDADSLNLQPPKAASNPDDAVTAERKKVAIESLRNRCRGVDQLSLEERAALKHDLTEGYSRNTSTLGQLHAITDDRWNSDQAKLITDSLYSDDPIVARTAFFALLSAFDSASPGGIERQRAFTYALGPQFVNFPLSDFERLQGCRTFGWCGSAWGARDDDDAPSSSVERLAAQYRAAVQGHMDARSILAIR